MPKRRKNDHDDDDHHGHSKSSKKGGGGDDEGNQNAIPIFLKKTYRMIETCDPGICSWSADGEMFVVKNPDLFASEIIPQYFDHNKFSSFARQLNFYGFRKIQTKPIRNEDFDKSTAKHVTFFNDKFKRGRYDLLKEIQRSTRGGGAQASLADQAREMETLRSTVLTLEQRVSELEGRWHEVGIKMEREIQAKVEMAMMDLLSSGSSAGRGGVGVGGNHNLPAGAAAALQAQYMGMPSLPSSSFGDAAILQRAERSFGSIGRNPHGTWENPLLGTQAARAFSTASASSLGNKGAGASNGGAGGRQVMDLASDSSDRGGSGGAAPTLPPHPKQKSLPPPSASGGGGQLPPTTSAAGALRQMSGGLSLGSAANSSLLLRNAWEDKFFSTMMMSDGASRAASLAGLANGMAGAGAMAAAAGAGNVSGMAALVAAQQQMQNQQHQAQQRMVQTLAQQQQRGMGSGRNVSFGGANGGGGGGESSSGKASNLKRQTTAEILLEAAGELGSSGRDKGAQAGSDDDS